MLQYYTDIIYKTKNKPYNYYGKMFYLIALQVIQVTCITRLLETKVNFSNFKVIFTTISFSATPYIIHVMYRQPTTPVSLSCCRKLQPQTTQT